MEQVFKFFSFRFFMKSELFLYALNLHLSTYVYSTFSIQFASIYVIIYSFYTQITIKAVCYKRGRSGTRTTYTDTKLNQKISVTCFSDSSIKMLALKFCRCGRSEQKYYFILMKQFIANRFPSSFFFLISLFKGTGLFPIRSSIRFIDVEIFFHFQKF